ncbi:hypothetical protein ACFVOB_22000 [Streptomyces rochei]
MSAPLVVNTRDGACWTRRTVTEGGIALYALADVCKCPEFVMATLPELAERGIVGSADALPMPVGTEPKPFDGFRIVVEVANADGRGDAEWAAELTENALEGQGFKASVTVDEGAQDVAALRTRVAELEARLTEPGASQDRPDPYVATPEAHAQMRESLTRYFSGDAEAGEPS